MRKRTKNSGNTNRSNADNSRSGLKKTKADNDLLYDFLLAKSEQNEALKKLLDKIIQHEKRDKSLPKN